MSALDELIYDRTQTDVTYAAELNRKLGRGEALTAQELADWNAGLKGAYNASDMNRVDAAVRELGGLLTAAGYPVEYVDPSPDTPSGGSNEIMLTASDFQSGFLYYASGNHSPSDNYLCTQTFIAVQPNVTVAVRTNASLSSDSGFIWYDSNKSYIGGTTGGVSTLWNSCFQAIPPTGTAYCKFNLNIPDIAGGDPGKVIVRQCENPEEQGAPNGYTQVEYIESDGSQYIDTGFKANQDTRIVFDADVLEVTSTATGLFGCRDKIGSNGFYIFETTSSSGNYNDGYGNSYTTSIKLSASGKHKIDKNKNITYIDGTVGYTYSTQTFTTPVTVTLFTVNQSSGVDERMSKLKLYSCVIYDNDIIVRYYIPCVNEFGIVGLYDTVSGAFFRDANSSGVGLYNAVNEQFYTNAGSGVFTGGANVSKGFAHGDVIPRPPARDYWIVGDIINQEVWTQYIVNVKSIRDAYYIMTSSPELPEPTAPLTYDGANAIEKLLYDISQLYDAMVASYRLCGTFQSGANSQHLPLQRSVT